MRGRQDPRDSADRRVTGTDIPRSETSRDFTPELLAEAARRLGWLCLTYAGGSILGHFEHWAAIAWAGTIDWSQHVPAVFGFAAVLMGIAVYVVSRRGLLPPRRLLDLGLVFQVVGAPGIAAKEYWGVAPHVSDGSFLLVPAECVWIVAYPLIVPNTRTRCWSRRCSPRPWDQQRSRSGHSSAAHPSTTRSHGPRTSCRRTICPRSLPIWPLASSMASVSG